MTKRTKMKAAVLLRLLLTAQVAFSNKGQEQKFCELQIVDGDLKKVGDCEEIDAKPFFADLARRAEDEKRSGLGDSTSDQITASTVGSQSTTPEMTVENLVTTLSQTDLNEKKCADDAGMVLNSKCFTVPNFSAARNINYNGAVAECARHKALLAEFHDSAQQRELHEFLLKLIPAGQESIDIWVGMEYQKQTSTLLYRSGKQHPISQLKWHPNWPSASQPHHLYLFVVNESRSGLLNTADSTNYHGVLCEKDI